MRCCDSCYTGDRYYMLTQLQRGSTLQGSVNTYCSVSL
jgi:hypothetical protein